MIKNLLPKKCIFQKKVDNLETLFKAKKLQIGLNENENCVIHKNGEIIIDFGKEIFGGVRILISQVLGKGKVRIVFGESVQETLSKIGYKNSTNDHAVRDTVLDIVNLSDFSYGKTGFRFIRLIPQNDTEISIKAIVGESISTSKKFDGEFDCDDDLVNKIFNTASYTIRLCLQNGFVWDGIKRDKLVWVGDLIVENKVLSYLVNAKEEIENSLLFAKEQTPLPNWINDIPMYSMWWIIVLWDKYLHDGDKDFLFQQKDYVLGIIDQIDKKIEKNGKTNFPYNFIDIHTHYLTKLDSGCSCKSNGNNEEKKYDELAGVKALTKMCLDSAYNIFNELGINNSCKKILKKLNVSKENVRHYKSASALRVFSNHYNENDKKILLNNMTEDISTFMSYFIFKAISKIGYCEEAVDLMKKYFGKMLDLGATTFWEDFDIKWAEDCDRIDAMKTKNGDAHGDFGTMCCLGYRKSLCHGWASGVVAFLMEEIAGIQILEPKCKKIKIIPNLCKLQFVNVCFPTPFGKVKINHKRGKNGEIITNFTAPKEIEIEISNEE